MAALISPGVSVSVVDQSTGSGSGQGTIPFIILATAQDKVAAGATETAQGTLAANAGQVYLMSSQRELLQTFGDPIFQSVGGTSLHGDPLNEYGLLAAHSYLGTANRVYVARADVALEQLEPRITEPDSPLPVGTVWLDASQTNFGLMKYDTSGTVPVFTPVDIDYFFDPGFLEAGSNLTNFGTVGEHGARIEAGKLEYWLRLAASWVEMSTANLTSLPNSVLVDPVWPTTLSDGDYWLKSSPGNGGVNYVVRRRNSLGQYVLETMPLLADDAAADTYYQDAPSAGDFYAKYPVASELVAEFYQHDGDAWGIYSDIIGKRVEPTGDVTDGTYWYNAEVGLDLDGLSTVDLLVKSGSAWINITLPGFTDYGVARPEVYMQSSDPFLTLPSNTLKDNDVWVDTDQAAAYPVMYYWHDTNKAWVSIDTADQTTPHGIVFADARPAPDFEYVPDPASGHNNGGTAGDPDLDIDRPDPDLYPEGFLLWNTRYSTRNVKVWRDLWHVNSEVSAPEDDYAGRWVSASGNKENGAMLAGAGAQRQVVIESMRSFIVSNEAIRAESILFNIMAAPGFPELISDMVALNTDRKETAFIIGDSPMDLEANSTVLQQWLTNANGAAIDGPDGLVTANPYVGVYYPSGLGVNVDGSAVVVPPSHMMLRVFGYNDQVSYPWFAPAGLSRGRITNASSVGYINAEGEFVVAMLSLGTRDLLYENNVNPIAFINSQGITAYGQKTRGGGDSALDRINVARLVSHIRLQADRIAQPFLFEFNDNTTRSNVRTAFNRFLSEIVTLRGLYDFLVVVDGSNNTPARIDRNELWIDLVISPARTLEFIFIPIRIRNTGADLTETVSQVTDRTNL